MNRICGEQHYRHKLTDRAVRDIRQRYAAGGITQEALADEYGVSHVTIYWVIKRGTWKHVDESG